MQEVTVSCCWSWLIYIYIPWHFVILASCHELNSVFLSQSASLLWHYITLQNRLVFSTIQWLPQLQGQWLSKQICSFDYTVVVCRQVKTHWSHYAAKIIQRGSWPMWVVVQIIQRGSWPTWVAAQIIQRWSWPSRKEVSPWWMVTLVMTMDSKMFRC